MLRKKVIIPAAALVAAGIITIGAFGANADFSGKMDHDQMIQKLAQKLGVDQSKVQSALDELRQEHFQEMLTVMQDGLDQAIKDGRITQAQKDAILSKKRELKNRRDTERNNNRNLSQDQWRVKKQQDRAELEAWAKEQGVDLKYYFGPKGGHMGKRGDMMDKEWLN